MKLTDKELEGNKRPERGPYPQGVVNGPDPVTERGKRRRQASVAGVHNNKTGPAKKTRY